MRIQILIRGSQRLNAIDQASALLGEALERRGHAVSLTTWSPGRLSDDCAGADMLVLPYNPFMWGRRGFAPQLLRDVVSVRRRRSRPEIVLVMHELYLPITDVKSFLMGAWQRIQLVVLLLLADRRFASIQHWATRLSRLRQTGHLPSGSNLPDARAERSAVRRELGIEDAFVVASLSTGHPSQLVSYVEAALDRVGSEGIPVSFLQLGAGASDVRAPLGMPVERPGMLPAERLAALVAAADLLLTPFVDGVSTRRGSFMAGLCQEVTVLGTAGKHTDAMLAGRGLELVEVGSPDAYAERAVELMRDDRWRARAARAGRRLFDEEFTWDVIAGRLLDGSSVHSVAPRPCSG